MQESVVIVKTETAVFVLAVWTKTCARLLKGQAPALAKGEGSCLGTTRTRRTQMQTSLVKIRRQIVYHAGDLGLCGRGVYGGIKAALLWLVCVRISLKGFVSAATSLVIWGIHRLIVYFIICIITASCNNTSTY